MSELNQFEMLDHFEEMKERVTLTFEERRVLNKYLQLFSTSTMEMQEVIRQLMQERSIDTAIGVQLDIIGDIVGQPREIMDAEFVEWFGYYGWPSSRSYGVLGRTDIGGRYWDGDSPLTSSVFLDDDQYRTFIKAKIVKNVTRATPEDVIDYLKFVFNATYVQINELQNADEIGVNVLVAGQFTDFEMALLSTYRTTHFNEWFFPKTLGIPISFSVVSGIPFIYGPDLLNKGAGYGSSILPDIAGGLYAGNVLI